MLSSEFDWYLKTLEVHDSLFKDYDVRFAKQLVVEAPREVLMVNVSPYFTIIGKRNQKISNRIQLDIIRVDWKIVRSDEVDVYFPLLFSTEPQGFMLLDGWHRVARASLDGQLALPAIFLTRQETKRCEVPEP